MLQFTCGLSSGTPRLFCLQGYNVYCNLNHDHTGEDMILYSSYSEPPWYYLKYFQVAFVPTMLCEMDFTMFNWNYNANANVTLHIAFVDVWKDSLVWFILTINYPESYSTL